MGCCARLFRRPPATRSPGQTRIYFPKSRFAFALIPAAWAGDSLPALFLGDELFGFDLVSPVLQRAFICWQVRIE